MTKITPFSRTRPAKSKAHAMMFFFDIILYDLLTMIALLEVHSSP